MLPRKNDQVCPLIPYSVAYANMFSIPVLMKFFSAVHLVSFSAGDFWSEGGMRPFFFVAGRVTLLAGEVTRYVINPWSRSTR